MAHKHSVYDTDAHFSINPFTRAIKNESTSKVTVIQHDHNSERFTFEIPRLVDGHDMSLCDRVEVHYINMDSANKDNISADIYEVNDLQVSPDDRNFVICSWLLSQNATKYAGSLNFLVRFVCLDGEKIAYAWHTAIFTGISVSSGILNNAEEIIEPYVDVLAQWKADLFSASEEGVVNITTAETNALAAIEAAGEAKKQAVLDSIPDEYEAVSALADQNHRNKAGAIVLGADGESIVLSDASEYPLQGLKLFGKSTQDGTPTPDAPVDIVSVENAGVRVCGKNLLKNIAKNSTSNGITFTVNEDGSVTVDGTATAGAWMNVSGSFTLPKGTYILSGCPDGGVYASTYVLSATTAADYGNTKTFTIEEETDIVVNIGVYQGCVVNNLTFFPMIRLASVEDDTYEPYAEAQTIETAHTIPGIPVSSGGNYTDANGQEWICDEVDLKRGVYVQRVYSESRVFSYDEINNRYSTTLTHTANAGCADGQGIPVFSDILPFNNAAGAGNPVINGMRGAASSPKYVIAYYNGEEITNATVTYPLATPIETPLSDAEINAFKALHSNKPNTTILNDAGAFMAVEYVADTKTYIDNKIKELMEGVTE